MTPEGEVKQDVKALFASKGELAWYYMPVPMGYGKTGVPDFVACYRSFFLAPETKRRKGGKARARQNIEQEGIRNAGGRADYVTNATQVKLWMDTVDAFWAWVAEKRGQA